LSHVGGGGGRSGLRSRTVASKDLLPGYVEGLRREIEAAEALGARPVAELEGDPRVRDEALMRLGRILDALHDVTLLSARRGGPRRPGMVASVGALAEGHGRLGAGLHEAMPLLTMARRRAVGSMELASMSAPRLHASLVASGRLRRWMFGRPWRSGCDIP